MFVMHCRVDKTETLKYPQPSSSYRKRGKKRKKDTSCVETTGARDAVSDDVDTTTNDEDLYNAVKCTECNTVVGVMDSDEVVHFFNVLASH